MPRMSGVSGPIYNSRAVTPLALSAGRALLYLGRGHTALPAISAARIGRIRCTARATRTASQSFVGAGLEAPASRRVLRWWRITETWCCGGQIALKKLTLSEGSKREARRTRVQLEAARFTGDASIVFDRESGATEVAGALGDR